MRLRELAERLSLRIFCGDDRLDREVSGGYASDLMSDVIAHAREGEIWLTLQTHLNIVAVALTKDLAAVALTGGREPDPDTLGRAREEGIPILSSPLNAFELAGRLYELGIRSGR